MGMEGLPVIEIVHRPRAWLLRLASGASGLPVDGGHVWPVRAVPVSVVCASCSCRNHDQGVATMKTRMTIVAAALALLFGHAQGASLNYQAQYQIVNEPSVTFSMPKFDTKLGTLDAISMTSSFDFHVTQVLDNLTGTRQTYSWNVGATSFLFSPDADRYLFVQIASSSMTTIDLLPYAGLSIFNFEGVHPLESILLPSEEFKYFQSNVPGDAFSLTGNAVTWHLGNPRSSYFIVNAQVTMQYDYTPAALNPIPEPHAYTMMLAGLGLLGVVGRYRKQKRIA
jgi:hypothetical protein